MDPSRERSIRLRNKCGGPSKERSEIYIVKGKVGQIERIEVKKPGGLVPVGLFVP